MNEGILRPSGRQPSDQANRLGPWVSL